MTYFVMCCYAIYIWPQDHKLKLDFYSKIGYKILISFEILKYLNESCIIGLCGYVFFIFFKLYYIIRFSSFFSFFFLLFMVLQPDYRV